MAVKALIELVTQHETKIGLTPFASPPPPGRGQNKPTHQTPTKIGKRGSGGRTQQPNYSWSDVTIIVLVLANV